MPSRPAALPSRPAGTGVPAGGHCRFRPREAEYWRHARAWRELAGQRGMAFSRLGRAVRGPGRRPSRQRCETGGATAHPGGRGRPDRAGQPDRAQRGQQRGRRVRGGGPGGHVVLQCLGGSGTRPGSTRAANHHRPVRGAGPVHRPAAGPGSAGTAVHPGRHAARPRSAVLGDGRGGVAQRRADPAAGRVRRSRAAEGVRRDPQRDRAAAAAGRDHAGDRERQVVAGVTDRLHGRGRAGGRAGRPARRRADRGRLGAADRDADLPGRDGAGVPAA